ncbi:fumarate reductase subunit A [Betaproteobacteria bacterium]|nr:fumarate reductase subunit A [Betaproteobacteria bacterium]
MEKEMTITHEADVLVIGGGAAGSIAAIGAKDAGAGRVLLVNKGFLGRTGITASTQGALTGVLQSPDEPERFVQDMLKCGHQLNDVGHVRRYVNEINAGAVLDLERLGVTFDRDADDKLRALKVGGHSFPRMLMATWLTSTTILRYGLIPQILRNGINVVDQMIITKLMLDDGRVCGAVGLNARTGTIEVFRAKAVILATGNAGQLFGESAGLSATGDGYSLAYQAGASLRDMEFVSCTIGLAHPEGLRGKVIGEPSTIPGSKPQLFNALNERFLEKYYPDTTLFTKDMYMLGIARELKAGRGTPHGGVWYDFSNLDPDGPSNPFVMQVLGMLDESIRKQGVLECTLAPYYFPGGVEYDEHHESSVPGLFVAGEVAGGLHGAERMASTAMAEAVVFGQRAGRCAAAATLERPSAKINPEDVVRETKRLYDMLEQKGTQRTLEVRRRLQTVMWDRVGFLRNEASLTAAQRALEQIGHEDFPAVGIRSKNPKANLDWVEHIENQFLLDCATMVTSAALQRTESRGSHYREDAPAETPEWVKKIILQKEGDRMQTNVRDV